MYTGVSPYRNFLAPIRSFEIQKQNLLQCRDFARERLSAQKNVESSTYTASSCTHLQEEEDVTGVGTRRRTSLPVFRGVCRGRRGGGDRGSSFVRFLFCVLCRFLVLVLVLLQKLDMGYSGFGIHLLHLAPPAEIHTGRI